MASILDIFAQAKYVWLEKTSAYEALYKLSTQKQYVEELRNMTPPLGTTPQNLYATTIPEASPFIQHVQACVPSTSPVEPAQNNFEFIPLRNLLSYVLRKQGHGITSAQQRAFSESCQDPANISRIPCRMIRNFSPAFRTWVEQLSSDNQCAFANAMLWYIASPPVPIASQTTTPAATNTAIKGALSPKLFQLPSYPTVPKMAYARHVENNPGFLDKYGLYILAVVVIVLISFFGYSMAKVVKEEPAIVGSCWWKSEFAQAREKLEKVSEKVSGADSV